MSAALDLVRRWVVDYFNRHDAQAARGFCAPDYTLSIGDIVLSGRDDAWLPAVDRQMRMFPHLGMSVHQTLSGVDWAAVAFSEHGATEGKQAVWSGVAIYRTAGGMLTGCVAQEDYYTRRRQLKSGRADPVDPPCPAPWDEPVGLPDPQAEAVVRRWLEGDWPRDEREATEPALRCDDDHITGTPLRFAVRAIAHEEIRSSGDHVAFHVRLEGLYGGGLEAEVTDAVPETLDCNGIVRVRDGQVVGGRIVRDRMGLWSRLKARAAQGVEQGRTGA